MVPECCLFPVGAAAMFVYGWTHAGASEPEYGATTVRRIQDVTTTNAPALGSKPAGAGPYGALDMSGNTREWTADQPFGEGTRRPSEATTVGAISALVNFCCELGRVL